MLRVLKSQPSSLPDKPVDGFLNRSRLARRWKSLTDPPRPLASEEQSQRYRLLTNAMVVLFVGILALQLSVALTKPFEDWIRAPIPLAVGSVSSFSSCSISTSAGHCVSPWQRPSSSPPAGS
ncbi:MAG: hypothetical protein IPK19_41560 [Chloroflexi bacterium]|nr:hypothetical protein [Chloroflexota bacterium]